VEQQAEKTSSIKPNKVVLLVSKVMAAVASLTLGAMMMIAVVDVFCRFSFNKPINGSFELGGILLVIAGTWGMGYCQLNKKNIRIDLLVNRFPEKGQAVFDIFAYFFCIVVAGTITWRVALMTKEYINAQQGALTATLLMPLWPFMLMLAMGFGWLTIIFLIDLYKSIIKVVKK
jgi:TRAP-type C4-dicarboxylate transport system permease small subunit